jgi:hypothetical protein
MKVTSIPVSGDDRHIDTASEVAGTRRVALPGAGKG